jgi:tripeptide aminopeptidase
MAESVNDSIETLRSSTAFRTARACIHETDAQTIADMEAVTIIPAPTGAEGERGKWIRQHFHDLGLDTSVDEAGNVIAVSPAGEPDAPEVAVVAHLDTVFAADADLSIRRADGRISAPGISDNGRGLAGMLALARALRAAEWPTQAPVAFIATVGEEGAGDLRGAKHCVATRGHRMAAFIALDGAGASRVIHAGVGSRRMRATFRTRGGHSWADWGAPNAIHAAGRAIARLADLELPLEPRTTLTVARTGGGTSINAIPSEAWIELDLRSERRDPLRELETTVRDILHRAADNEATPDVAVSCTIDVFGDRPAGETPARHPLVRLAQDATRAVDLTPELTSSSTDANVAMAEGIPAIAIGAGGDAGGIHTPDEWYENLNGPLGLERALMIVMMVGSRFA